jgi:hypothetical protein
MVYLPLLPTADEVEVLKNKNALAYKANPQIAPKN